MCLQGCVREGTELCAPIPALCWEQNWGTGFASKSRRRSGCATTRCMHTTPLCYRRHSLGMRVRGGSNLPIQYHALPWCWWWVHTCATHPIRTATLWTGERSAAHCRWAEVALWDTCCDCWILPTALLGQCMVLGEQPPGAAGALIGCDCALIQRAEVALFLILQHAVHVSNLRETNRAFFFLIFFFFCACDRKLKSAMKPSLPFFNSLVFGNLNSKVWKIHYY